MVESNLMYKKCDITCRAWTNIHIAKLLSYLLFSHCCHFSFMLLLLFLREKCVALPQHRNPFRDLLTVSVQVFQTSLNKEYKRNSLWVCQQLKIWIYIITNHRFRILKDQRGKNVIKPDEVIYNIFGMEMSFIQFPY